MTGDNVENGVDENFVREIRNELSTSIKAVESASQAGLKEGNAALIKARDQLKSIQLKSENTLNQKIATTNSTVQSARQQLSAQIGQSMASIGVALSTEGAARRAAIQETKNNLFKAREELNSSIEKETLLREQDTEKQKQAIIKEATARLDSIATLEATLTAKIETDKVETLAEIEAEKVKRKEQDALIRVDIGNGYNQLNRLEETVTTLQIEITEFKKMLAGRAFLDFINEECPEGFIEITGAAGRFIRIKDGSGTIDPDGQIRAVGSMQGDSLKTHTHSYDDAYSISRNIGISYYAAILNGSTTASFTTFTNILKQTNGTGETETRPKNILAIICQYQG